MKDFRDELLETLLAKPVEVIDIKYLTDKYCGEDDTFEAGDETKSKCRLRINRILRELEKMEWINLQPQGGISTAHTYNHVLNKRQFLDYGPVKVRLTTKGEMEYRKFIRENEPPKAGISITGDVIGSMVGSQSLESAFISPTVHNTTNINPNKPHKRSWLEILAWVIGIASGLFVIWEFVLKRFLNSP